MIEFNSQYNYENKSTFLLDKINPLILITTKPYILVKLSPLTRYYSLTLLKFWASMTLPSLYNTRLCQFPVPTFESPGVIKSILDFEAQNCKT